jgi:hypothetical protein
VAVALLGAANMIAATSAPQIANHPINLRFEMRTVLMVHLSSCRCPL